MYYSNNQNQNSNNSKIEQQQQSLKKNQDNLTKQQSTKNNEATNKNNLNNYNNNGQVSPIIIKVENEPGPIESALSADGSALKQEDEGRIVSPPPPGPRPQIKISVGINMNLVRPRTKPNPDPTVSPIVARSSPQPRKVISCIMPSWFISKDTQQQQQQKQQQQNPGEKSKLDFSPSMLHDLPSDSMCSMHLERTKLEPIESSDIYLYVKKPVKDQPTAAAEGAAEGGGKGQNGKQSKSVSKSLTYELLHIKPFVPFKPKPRTKPFIPQLKPMFATTGDDNGGTSQNKVSKQNGQIRQFSYQELLDIKPFVPIKPKPRTKPFIPQLKPTSQYFDVADKDGQSPTKVEQQFPNSTVAKSAPGAMQPNGTGAGNPTAAFTADSKCRLQLKRPARPSCYTPNYHKAPFIDKHSSGSSSLNNAKQTPSLIADLPSTEVQSLILEKSQLVPIEDSFYFQWKDRPSKLFINASRSANGPKLPSPLAAIRFNSDGAIDYKLSKTKSDPPAVSKPSPSTLADLPSTSACSIHLERKELVPIENSEPFLFQPHQPQQQNKLKKNQTKHAKKSSSSESPMTKTATTTPVFKIPFFGEQIPDLKFLAMQARSMFKIDMLEKPPSTTEERAKVAPSIDMELQTKVSETPQSSTPEDKVSTPSKSKPKTITKIETLSSTIRSDSKHTCLNPETKAIQQKSPVAPSAPSPPTSNTIKKQQEALSETIRSNSQNVLTIKPPSPPTPVAPSTSPEPLIVVRAKTSKLSVPFQQQKQRSRPNQYGEKELKDSTVPNNVNLTTPAPAPPTKIDYVDTVGLLSALLNTPLATTTLSSPPQPPSPAAPPAAAAPAQPAQATTKSAAASAATSASSSPGSSSHPKNKPNKILSVQRNVSLYKNLANTGNAAGGGATTVAETKLKTNKASVRTSGGGGGGSAGSGGNKPAATNHHYHRTKPLIKNSNLAVMPATTGATRPQHRTTTPKPETRIQRHRQRTPHTSRQNSPKTARGRTSNKPAAAHNSHKTPNTTTSPNTNQHPIVLSSSFASSLANSNASAPVSIPATTNATRAPVATIRKPHQNSNSNRAKVNVTNQKNHKSLSPTTAPPPPPPPSSTPAPTQNNKNKNKSKKSTNPNTTTATTTTNKDQQQTAPPSTDFDYKEPKLIKSNPKALSNKTVTTNTNNTTNTSKSNNKHIKNSDSTGKSKAKPGLRTTIAKPPHRWTSYFFRRPPKSS